MNLSLDSLDAMVFDFDGVFTDNRVWVSESGEESVACSRSDGLALDALRRYQVKLFILSTEANNVVRKRAEKLKIPVFNGVSDKAVALKDLARREGFALDRTLYVGNDVNDLIAMQLCAYRVCPADSHPRIASVATHRLSTNGGYGVVRELAERILNIDVLA